MVGEVAGAQLQARRIVGFALPGSDPEAITVEDGEWPAFFRHVVDQRLTGLAVAALEAGRLTLGKPESEPLLERHRQAMVQALALERALLGLVAALEGSGVEVVVLKGSALAHTVYPDPSWRPYGDVDLLVRSTDWRRACLVLDELGFHRKLPEPRPGFDERFGKAAAHRDGLGLEVDLHRTLVVGPFGLWMQPEELFDRTTTFELGGRTLRRLDDTALLLHACVHASLGWTPPLLMPVRDVVQVAASGDVDWVLLGHLAGGWRLGPVVRHAFQTASEILGTPWPVRGRAVLAAEPRRRDRRALEAYTTSRRRRGGTALTTIRAIPGLRAKATYLRDLLFPDPEFLTARTGERKRALLRRWAVPVRWLVRRRRWT